MLGRDAYSNERSWSLVAGTAFLGATTIWVSYLVHSYGIEGALRYIWEGDPNPEHIREQAEKLNAAEKALKKQTKAISTFEEALQRARLDTIDESDPGAIVLVWKRNLPKTLQDLQMRLAFLSTDLDKIASQIDQVQIDQVFEDGDERKDEVRTRKRFLSKHAVKLMERADALIAFYKTAAPS